MAAPIAQPRWNWQQPDWPSFRWSAPRLARAEEQCLLGAGVWLGAISHLENDDRIRVSVESLGADAVASSAIEGETLDRESVQSSIRRHFGLAFDAMRVRPAEQGMAEMMVDLVRSVADPLTHETLHRWQVHALRGRSDLRDVGRYRTHVGPMQIVSGRMHVPKVHFEAPPSVGVEREMERFLAWFNGDAGHGGPSTLARAGIAHLHFESIHPFEDGNGRVGRAIAEKALAQCLSRRAGRPVWCPIASALLARRGEYYAELGAASRSNDITRWLAWFAGIVLEAQARAIDDIHFIIEKSSMLARLQDQLNARQTKVLLRMMREGSGGFEGGMTAGKYMAIARTSPATTTRDLGELVALGALERVGAKRSTRYDLAMPRRAAVRVRIGADGEVLREGTAQSRGHFP